MGVFDVAGRISKSVQVEEFSYKYLGREGTDGRNQIFSYSQITIYDLNN